MPTAAWAWLFAAYSYGVTTVTAAWFARRFAAARGASLEVGRSLLWQGAVYAAWLPAAGLVWWVLRRWGAGPRGVAILTLAMPAVVALESLASTGLDHLLAGSPDPWTGALARAPVCILLYTALVAAGLAAAHHRRAGEARARAQGLETALAEARAALAPSQEPQTVERLMVMAGARRVPVTPGEVEWFGAADNYVVVHWADGQGSGREGLLRATLQSLEARLDPKVFARAHRSALVNLARVRETAPLSDGSWRLTMESGAEVVTSRTYRDELLKRLGR